jgi:hypothetical protein
MRLRRSKIGAVRGAQLKQETDMSIRKRTWKTTRGDAREAWIVDYVDQGGKRR